ncbi:hypothetical protein B0H10DRAFT_375149 [Mycena sp. CBHHK59/15]|nr:hypothetical protein B0H10DRAFT_375149 [Mycena sp. CBHHK59/15]
MRFSTVFAALSVVASGASAATSFSSAAISSALTLTKENHYGAAIPPWEVNHHPGWYFGNGAPPSGIACILDGLFCKLLELFSFCFHCPQPPKHPTPPPEFTPTFSNLTCAAQSDTYQTYGLVDTVAACAAMCDSVSGCTFFNTYHDVNGKNGSPLLTCSLFTSCLPASSADNCGGQTQPDGSIDFITNSDGYCKKKATA